MIGATVCFSLTSSSSVSVCALRCPCPGAQVQGWVRGFPPPRGTALQNSGLQLGVHLNTQGGYSENQGPGEYRAVSRVEIRVDRGFQKASQVIPGLFSGEKQLVIYSVSE